jgi:hypothetical protein
MSQTLTLKAKGLYSSWSEFADVPEGALLQADNIDISQDNIIEPRRGFERQSAGFTNSLDRADKIWFYQDKQFAHHGETPFAADDISYLNAGVWTSIGAYSAPSDARVRTLEASQNLYFSTSTGVQKLDAFNATPRLSGAFKGLDLQASTTGSSGFLAKDFRVAYRVVWGIEDANKNLQLGAPSQRVDVTNGAVHNRDVSLTITIPDGVTTAWLFQVYRSAQVDNTPPLDVEPNDELQLVYENNPTSGEIAAGQITFTDVTPDSLRGATIYTAASQEGIANQNERPPLAKDLASFRDVVFFANTTSKNRYNITILAIGGSGGIVNDDTITIDSIVYTGKATETIASGQFAVASVGSASQLIKDTALSLVRVINRYASSTVYAYYLSGPNDLPGKILLEERGIGGAAFPVIVSRQGSWSPTDIPSSGTTETSANDRLKNGLQWSKPFQPEAAPLVNQVQVGNKDANILRIVPLKDALIIFKEDGIYRLTGYYPSFDIELLDSSARIVGSETPQILNNQIFCLTDQGISVVSDSVKIISRPIELSILELFAADLDLVKQAGFGVSYEIDRKYYLWLPTSASDTTATQAFVYNVFTSTWVRHSIIAQTALATSTNLYYANPNSEYIFKDKRSFTYTDYADFKAQVTITAIDENVFTVDSIANAAVGDLLFESSVLVGTISSIDSLNSTVTVEGNPGFTTTTVDILSAISAAIKWVPIAAGNPGVTKQFHTTQLVFKKDIIGDGFMTYSSDLSESTDEVALPGSQIGAWGLFTWGSVPWGGEPRKRPISQWVPRAKQRCSQLTVGFTHSVAYSNWQLQGLSVHFTPGTDNTDR